MNKKILNNKSSEQGLIIRFRMDILNLPFEEPLIIECKGEKIQLVAFKTQEYGNIKFGINAPRNIKVHREEIYEAIKQKEEDTACS